MIFFFKLQVVAYEHETISLEYMLSEGAHDMTLSLLQHKGWMINWFPQPSPAPHPPNVYVAILTQT